MNVLYISGYFYRNKQNSYAALTWRLAMLLALTSARRASDLTLLQMDDSHLFKSAYSWRFHSFLGAKQDRPGQLPQDVVLS